ncbi:hypothetical protein [Cellvibrio sp. NN19]|uniref:hypothetical protein n=1 Tax=Cellvibrio chitinivorans TaxID=3102792 RepID=UPI002B40AB9B|nr:hypothetical protein [Cellvibrio sp. NN19]
MKSIIKNLVFSIAALTGASFNVSAESPPVEPTYHVTYGISDWRELVPERAAEYKNFRVIVLSNTSYSDDEKAAKIARKYTEIRDFVKNARTEAYSNVSEVRGVGNSATKGSSGGSPKKVDAKCTGASKSNMYTKPEWAKGAYKSGDEPANEQILNNGSRVNSTDIVKNNGTEVCAIALKQSGKGRKVSYSEATFRIHPDYIKVMVDAEVLAMMYDISHTPI